jgi:hypothetical protein
VRPRRRRWRHGAAPGARPSRGSDPERARSVNHARARDDSGLS